jgi:hypothetical protein
MGAAARDALDRDGNSLEGAFGPRSRRGLMRGGVQPSSEAEYRSRVIQPSSETDPHSRGDRPTSEADLYRGGTVSLERSGVLPKGGWADFLTGRGPAGSFCACVEVRFRLFFTSLSGVPLVV